MAEKLETAPWHLIAQVANQSAFFEVIDTHAPFLIDYELPQAEDYKKDKFTIAITEFGGKTQQLQHYLDKKELLLLVDQMSRGVKGMELPEKDGDGNTAYRPILESFKGSPDRAHPDWELTSRTLRVTFKKMRMGYVYSFEITHQEGKKMGKGAIAPSGNKNGIIKASFPLPYYAERNPPGALHVAQLTKSYIAARDVAKMELWSRSLRNLRAAVKREPNGEFAQALREFKETYGQKSQKSDDETDGTYYDDRDDRRDDRDRRD